MRTRKQLRQATHREMEARKAAEGWVQTLAGTLRGIRGHFPKEYHLGKTYMGPMTGQELEQVDAFIRATKI